MRASSSSGSVLTGRLARLATAVRERRRSAVELVEESLARIEAARALNAVVAVRTEAALREAHETDERIRRGEVAGPLAGLPLLVKDVEDVAGMPTTFGSLLIESAPAATDDGLVPSRLRRAGAIVVGKTNTSEFAHEAYTFNRLFGATSNPWAPAWSPGGSSGGSGAALIAGLAPIATASDGGGSIRIPAALCGLAGLKPTNGAIGRRPIPQWMDLSTDGPLAGSIEDLRLLISIEAGPVPGDPTASPSPWQPADSGLNVRLLAIERIADGPPVSASVRSLFETALAALESDLGFHIERVSPSAIIRSGDIDEDWATIAGCEQAFALGRATIEQHGDQLDPLLQRWMRRSLDVSLEDYLAARRRRFDYVRAVDELLGTDTLLVMPTLCLEGWSNDGRLPDPTASTGWGVRTGLPGWIFNTQAFNMTGHPALSVPAGRHPNGLPFGIQFVGPRFRDDLVLEIGAAWEAARPWPAAADGYTPFGE